MALLFTPQQLVGGQRYSSHTRLGNWLEDEDLKERQTTEFAERRARGGLAVTSYQKKMAVHNQVVPHAYGDTVRFGDAIVLAHLDANGALACDLYEETSPGSRQTPLRVAQAVAPVARSAFVITPPPGDAAEAMAGTELLYGSPFCLASNPSLLIDPEDDEMLTPAWFVRSEAYNGRNGSRKLNNQAAYMAPLHDSASVWIARPTAGGVPRLLAEASGTPVPSGTPIVLAHALTGMPLYCGGEPKHADVTEWGAEHEVSCKADRDNKLRLMSHHQAMGTETPATSCRPEKSGNHWAMLTSKSEGAAEDRRNLPPPPSVGMLVAKVKRALRARSGVRGGGVKGLRKMFSKMDSAVADSYLDAEEFKWGLFDYGVRLSADQLAMLTEAFDTNKDGMVSFQEFLKALRLPLTGDRKAAVDDVFDRLDPSGDGSVSLGELERVYDAAGHPMVLSGEMTATEATAEFMALWDTGVVDGAVTYDEFCDQYVDLGALVEDDAEFVAIVRAAWAPLLQ